MAHLIGQHGLGHSLECDSAGTTGFHTGNSPDSRMTRAAAKRGIRLSGRARQIQPSDLTAFDYILVADFENLEDVNRLAAQHKVTASIHRICEFCEAHENAQVVPDPYYGGEEGFEKVMDLLEDACQGFLRKHGFI